MNSDQESLTLKGHTTYVNSIVFSPDGKRILSGDGYGMIKLWDAATGQNTLTFMVGFCYRVAFSPDSKRILSASGSQGMIKVWDVATGQITHSFTVGRFYTVALLAFSPDSKRILSASGSQGLIKVWDVATGKNTLILKGHTTLKGGNIWVSDVAFSPDGKYIVSGSRGDGTIKVWDAATGQNTLTLTFKGVSSVAFSPDGKRIVSGGDGTIKVWDAATGQNTLTLTFKGVSSVAFSPDSKRIVSAGDGTIKFWDAATGQETLNLKGWVSPLAFSPDGKRILSGGEDQMIKVWDAVTGQGSFTLLKGHTAAVSRVAFSPDSKRIVSGSRDGTLKILPGAKGISPPNDEKKTIITNSIGMKLVYIQPGKFMMGSPNVERDRNIDEHQHEVEITKGFYMGVCEVTQAQFRKVMGKNPSQFSSSRGFGHTDDFPVEGVSWKDALDFCRLLDKKEKKPYDLPTEAEWEYACRAGTNTPFHCGKVLYQEEANYGNGNNPVINRVAARYITNDWGLYHMHGNVSEWCKDWYREDYYRVSPKQDPQGPDSGKYRVLRGGVHEKQNERLPFGLPLCRFTRSSPQHH